MKLITFVGIFALALISFSARSSQTELPGKEPSVTLPSVAIGVAAGVLLKIVYTIHRTVSLAPEDNNPLLKPSEQIDQDSYIVNGGCILTAIGVCYLSSHVLRYFAERSRKKGSLSKPSLDEPLPRYNLLRKSLGMSDPN